MDLDKALEKIKKCMARAESTDSPNEAETALRQARALMDQFHLDSGDILASNVSEDKVSCGTKACPPSWMQRLASVCAEAFGCTVVTSGFHLRRLSEGSWSFRFIGVGISSQMASYAYSMLHHQLVRARRLFVADQKRCKLATKRRRGDLFAQGWIDAVSAKVRQFAGVDEQVKLAIGAYERKHFPSMETTTLERVEPRRAHDARSMTEGWKAGKAVHLHQGLPREKQAALGLGG